MQALVQPPLPHARDRVAEVTDAALARPGRAVEVITW